MKRKKLFSAKEIQKNLINDYMNDSEVIFEKISLTYAPFLISESIYYHNKDNLKSDKQSKSDICKGNLKRTFT